VSKKNISMKFQREENLFKMNDKIKHLENNKIKCMNSHLLRSEEKLFEHYNAEFEFCSKNSS